MSTLSVKYQASLGVYLTVAAADMPAIDSNMATLKLTTFDTQTTLTASTTPGVTKETQWETTLTAGAATIDMSAKLTALGVAVGTGLKPIGVKFKMPGTNAGAMTIAKGASNGFTGFGSAFSITLPLGGEMQVYFASGGTATSGSVKTLDLTGTGTDKVQCQIIWGP